MQIPLREVKPTGEWHPRFRPFSPNRSRDRVREV